MFACAFSHVAQFREVLRKVASDDQVRRNQTKKRSLRVGATFIALYKSRATASDNEKCKCVSLALDGGVSISEVTCFKGWLDI